MQSRIQSLIDAETYLNKEIKKKEFHLRSLDYRTKERRVISMANSTDELTYRPDNMYPPLPDDPTIKPIPYM